MTLMQGLKIEPNSRNNAKYLELSLFSIIRNIGILFALFFYFKAFLYIIKLMNLKVKEALKKKKSKVSISIHKAVLRFLSAKDKKVK